MWWLSWNASRSCCSAYKLMKLHRVTAQLSLEEAAGDRLVQIPCSEQGQWGQFAQGHVDSGFRYLQGWRLHSLSAQPVPGCGHPHSNFFPYYFYVKCPVFQCMPTVSWLSVGLKEKSLGLSSLHTNQVFIHINKIPLIFFHLNSPRFLNLSSKERCSSPLIISMALHWTLSRKVMSLLHWEAQAQTQHWMCLTRAD